mmetsp:Transcript_49813/g.128161  ORF Transcript_49813/g.128161 Transcript_49813/m.128161 type:complete len:355 (+) Transcript_49813:897-1961(+)
MNLKLCETEIGRAKELTDVGVLEEATIGFISCLEELEQKVSDLVARPVRCNQVGLDNHFHHDVVEKRVKFGKRNGAIIISIHLSHQYVDLLPCKAQVGSLQALAELLSVQKATGVLISSIEGILDHGLEFIRVHTVNKEGIRISTDLCFSRICQLSCLLLCEEGLEEFYHQAEEFFVLDAAIIVLISFRQKQADVFVAESQILSLEKPLEFSVVQIARAISVCLAEYLSEMIEQLIASHAIKLRSSLLLVGKLSKVLSREFQCVAWLLSQHLPYKILQHIWEAFRDGVLSFDCLTLRNHDDVLLCFCTTRALTISYCCISSLATSRLPERIELKTCGSDKKQKRGATDVLFTKG